MDEEASDLYAVLIEQQKYNPSQAVKVLVHFRYCSSDEAWQIAKLYHAKQGINEQRHTHKQRKDSYKNSVKTAESYA
tara:strand:- start:398 stop:628 length:231 start_codon:yes stop_codon:yes gene_type:complete